MTRRGSWIWTALAVAAAGASGCNLVFGLDPPTATDGGASADGPLVDGPPVDARPALRVAAVALGGNHTCAALQTGEIRCWGANAVGQLGIGSTVAQVTPGPHVALPAAPTMVLAAGTGHACVTLENQGIACWGTGAHGQLGYGNTAQVGDDPGELALVAPLVLPQAPTALAGGGLHTCAATTDGVRCWGEGADGQLGTGSTEPLGATTAMPPGQAVPGTAGVTTLAAGRAHTCAVLPDTNVTCWGDDGRGQLGRNTSASVGGMPGFPLTRVPLGASVSALAAGLDHTCVLLADGAAACWGANGGGQLGDGTLTDRTGTVASRVMVPRQPIAITAGANHTCALAVTGDVYCWGANDQGQLGLGTTTPQRDGSAATPVVLGGQAKAVVAGLDHTCAILVDDTLVCWGAGANGKLGYGDTANRGDTPATTPALTGPVLL
ncbi:MAG: hypothetical protein R3B06_03340 [Kofleriaceae bacterium]